MVGACAAINAALVVCVAWLVLSVVKHSQEKVKCVEGIVLADHLLCTPLSSSAFECTVNVSLSSLSHKRTQQLPVVASVTVEGARAVDPGDTVWVSVPPPPMRPRPSLTSVATKRCTPPPEIGVETCVCLCVMCALVLAEIAVGVGRYAYLRKKHDRVTESAAMADVFQMVCPIPDVVLSIFSR